MYGNTYVCTTQRKEKQAKEATNVTCIGGLSPGWSAYSVKKSCPILGHPFADRDYFFSRKARRPPREDTES
uniref:Uncharacterized protein n=1 Tax=Hyaloperonospora arabidopsidis (strain Emoy2) TaxID=559515 RepID=M4BPU4_HYAAE